MSLTADQLALNRASAKNIAKVKLGLAGLPENQWTQEQMLNYNAALATIYASYPDQFSDQDLVNAEYVKAHPGEPLVDASFSLGDFATEATKPLTDAAQSVGSGFFTLANAAKWAVPLVAAIAVVILLFSFARKTGARQ